MGLCASRALGQLEEFEQEEEEEEEDEEECSFHIDSRASSAGMSCSSSRNSRNSTNSLFRTLSFDSSRSSAEVGEMGQLGSLFCKRRLSLVGNSDLLSAHLTNLLSSILCTPESKSPAEISFASYLSTPFIRPQGFERHALRMHDGLDAIAKSYAESAAKAAARDTFLFLNENDSLQSFETSPGTSPDELQGLRGYASASCVPEENDITLGDDDEDDEEEEEEEEDDDEIDVAAADTSSEDSDTGTTVDLFKPGMYYQEDELSTIAAQDTDQKSLLFEFCFPATTSRWASVVNAARQSALAWRNSEAQKDESSATNSQNNGVKLLQKVDCPNVAQKLDCRQGTDLAPDNAAREAAAAAAAFEEGSLANAGEFLLPSQSGEDSKNSHLGCLDCPTSCLRIRIISAGKECNDLGCSSSSMCGGISTQDHEAHVEDKEEEGPDPDPDSFFSFPSSPSSKLFEEVGSGHIIEQMKSTKLMQEMACRKSSLEDFQGIGLDDIEIRHKEGESASSAGQHSNPFGKAPSPASQATYERAAAPQTHFFNKRNFSREQQRDCNPAAAAVSSSKRFAASESFARTEDTSSSNPRDGHGGDESSCCESFDNDDNHHALGIRIMCFAGKDFACFQIKKCFNGNAVADVPSSGVMAAASASEPVTLRNPILHGGKASRKASSRAKSVKDAPCNKKTNCLEQFEESTTTLASSTGKSLLLLKLGLLRRKTLGC